MTRWPGASTRSPLARLVRGPRRGGSGPPRAPLAGRAGRATSWRLAPVVVVDDYFFPLYVVTPAAGHDGHPGLACLRRVQAVRLQRGRQDVRGGRPPARQVRDPCATTTSASSRRWPSRRTTPRPSTSRSSGSASDLGIPRTDVLFGSRADRADASPPPPPLRPADGQARRPRRPDVPRRERRRRPAPTSLPDLARSARRPRRRPRPARPPAPVRPRARRPSTASSTASLIDVSDHPDINELLLVATSLVTDYSSVIFEFALLGRPMVFFAPDHEAYERERGFYFDYRDRRPRARLRDDRGAGRGASATGAFDLAAVSRPSPSAPSTSPTARRPSGSSTELILPALRPPRSRTAPARPDPGEVAVRYAPRPSPGVGRPIHATGSFHRR